MSFVHFGPGSQWINQPDGVYRCYERLDRWQSFFCRLVGCWWKRVPQHYDPELVKRLRDDPMPHFLPKVILRCRVCGVTAVPFQTSKT